MILGGVYVVTVVNVIVDLSFEKELKQHTHTLAMETLLLLMILMLMTSEVFWLLTMLITRVVITPRNPRETPSPLKYFQWFLPTHGSVFALLYADRSMRASVSFAVSS